MASTIGTAYIQIEPSTKGIGKKLSGEMSSVGSSAGEKAGKGFNMSLGKIIGAAAVIGVAKKGAELTKDFVSGAVGAYGEYEQLIGGVETLFGDSANVISGYADAAYRTAGLSANDYMETVTSFSASLLQSLDGDTATAADKANQAIIDMSDNANKMGSSMESIQNAYQGFAKQNYTMLDNLKLGYGGTKGEMQRLLADATAISGIEFNLDSYADVVDAIHIIQENMGIAGTTAKEASTTLQGSLASMKAQWANLTTAIAADDWDVGVYIDNFVNAAETAFGNFEPVIMRSLDGVSALIEQLLPPIIEKIPPILEQVLPNIVSAGLKIIESLANGIIQAVPMLAPQLTQLITSLVNMLIALLPQLVTVGLDLIMTLAQGIMAALPELIPCLQELVTSLIDTLVQMLPQLIEMGMQMLLALSLGIAEALPELMPQVVDIVLVIIDTLVDNADLLIAAAVALIGGLVKGIANSLPKIIEAGKKMLKAALDGWKMMFSLVGQAANNMVENLKEKIIAKKNAMVEAGKNLIKSIKDGLVNAWNNVITWFQSKINDLKEKFLSAFDIKLPSWMGGGGGGGKNNEATTNSFDAINSYSYTPSAFSYMPNSMIGDQGNASNYNSTNVIVKLEGDANRLFRVMQAEASRNAMLVGV